MGALARQDINKRVLESWDPRWLNSAEVENTVFAHVQPLLY